MELNEWLKEERKKRGLSARKISEMLGRSSSYVSQIERGLIKDITYDMALELVTILELDEDVLSQFYVEHGTVKNARDTVQEMIDNYNNLGDTLDWQQEPEKAQSIEEYRKRFERALEGHIMMMETSELAGLLLLLSKQRHLLYELSTIPSYVKRDKDSHLYDMINKYTKFMKGEYKKEIKKEEK